MSFELRLTISGLCLFAQDDRAKQMHILMPATDKEFTGCNGAPMYVPSHIAWLVYERRYEDASSPAGQVAAVPLDGTSQIIGDGSSCAGTQLPHEVADLGQAARAVVPAKYITMPIDRPLAARLTLTAGEAVGCAPGARWDFGGNVDEELTPGVHWTMANIAGSTLGLNTAHGYKILSAIGHVIELSIFCVPPSNLPGLNGPPTPPPPGGPPAHFAAFYALCVAEHVQCPKFHGPSTQPPTDGGVLHDDGVNPFSCLVGTAPVGPTLNQRAPQAAR
jgi:hypothetical protein